MGAHQTSIPLPFQVTSTQHVLGDGLLPCTPPVQAFADFGVNDGHLQLLKGLRAGQGHWGQEERVSSVLASGPLYPPSSLPQR